MLMEKDATIVFHGFLSLPNKEKMQIVNAINEYFDSTEREPIRAGHDKRFDDLDVIGNAIECKCCGRS
jgi:hypothetical protein